MHLVQSTVNMSLIYHEKSLLESNKGKVHATSKETEKLPSLATLAIHTAVDCSPGARSHHPVVNPIFLSTTYELDYPGQENVQV